VLWHCWLGGRKGIRPVKNWVVGCWCSCLSGARSRLAYGPADATATHSLASVKFRLVLPFWYWLTSIVPEKRDVKRVCVQFFFTFVKFQFQLMEILLMLSANRRYLCLYLIKYDGSVVYKNQQPLTQGSHLENLWNFVDMKNSCNFCIFDLEFFLHSFAGFDIVKLCYEDIFSEVVLLNMALAFSYRHMENRSTMRICNLFCTTSTI